MKTLTAFLILAFIGFQANAQAKIEFKETTVNQGKVAYESNESWVFTLTNTGDEPLIIKEVATSCGCTTASRPTSSIAPGESDSIVVEYDTKIVGPIRKSVTVYSNAVNQPILALHIKGRVMPVAKEM